VRYAIAWITPFPSLIYILYRAFFERVDPALKTERKSWFLKNNLAITHAPQFEEEFGKYPVLHVDLSVSVFSFSFEINSAESCRM
jgi:hypothetical protein